MHLGNERSSSPCFVVVQVMNALRAEHAVDLYRYKAERAKIGKFPDFGGCLEDHPS